MTMGPHVSMGPQRTSFEMEVPRDPAVIPTVRRFVNELCTRLLGDADVTSRVVVATHELLDNAVRHAARDPEEWMSRIRVSLQHVQTDKRDRADITIETSNRAAPEGETELRRLLGEMRTSPDSKTFYLRLLHRVSKSENGGGLGLGRVVAESEMNVTGRFEDGIVHIRAEASFPLRRVVSPA